MEGRLPTTEDVMKKIKDDGDFDTLRLKIIRVVKENEELRKNIIDQVKQSNVLNQDGSEDMKPRQLSDAIYEEIGRKIMGQISDEIWKTIRSNESIKDDIKCTVEHVFNKMMSIEAHSLPQENEIVNGVLKSSTATPTREANIVNSNEINESNGDKIEQRKDSDLQENEERPGLIQKTQEIFNQTKVKDLLPGLGGGGGGGEADDDSDLPPGFS